MQSPSETSAGRPVKFSNQRWMMVFMAFLATAINYIDRANLSVAAPFIQKEFNLSPSVMGWILGAFFWTYAAFQMPSGWLVDKLGPRITYSIAVVWWSFFTAACALGNGFASLFGFRLLLGVGEAPAYPCNSKVVSEWFPKRERAFATSIFDSGAKVGGALALPIVALIVNAVGWRWSFVITGGLGFIWTVVWLKVYRHPRDHAKVSKEELAYIEDRDLATAATAAPVEDAPPVPFLHLFRYRIIWGMMLGFFCLNFVNYFFITWFPTYLVQARGFSLLKLSGYAMIPSLVAVGGGWLGGLTSDRLLRSGMKLTWARKIPLVGGMLASSAIALAVIAPNAFWALALMSVSYAGIMFAGASVWALPADIAPSRRNIGSIGGIQNCASNLAGVCISVFVGAMVTRTGGFVVPLTVAGCASLLGAFAYLVIVPDIAPLVPKTPARPPVPSPAGASGA
jgi:MFS transporter, ACS family, D-galactonate transporter